ncbi:hypothetical protein O6H91_08G024200 [Diphasiastrum complanatum]|uniref:Uncharacterized protein n=3 Tax=Diphasiastrum complanatum TaxID=34168 RepID=A0ACC2CVV0_DIPCM|nr:hypothetical protein O6H91_08G024200 [Diphasiastrum complanatum]
MAAAVMSFQAFCSAEKEVQCHIRYCKFIKVVEFEERMAGLLSGDASHLALTAGGTFLLVNGKLEEPEYSSSNWYFTRDEIEKNSPSRRDGVDVNKETYFRKSYCTFLQDLGMRLKVPQITIATATVMCHRFFLRQSHTRNEKFMVATICMFVAGKVEETPRPLRDVIILSYGLRNKKDPTAVQRIRQKDVFEEQKELMLLGEQLVLTTLEFDLNIHHPYKPLVTAIKRFKVAQNALAQVAWNFVNDGLRTSLCLQFKPHHIAAGAIFLATKFLQVNLPSGGDKVWWQEFEVTPRQLEDVSNQMLELYEQNKAGPSSRASDPNLIAGVCNGYKPEMETAVHTTHRELDFDSQDSSRGYLHGWLEGGKQGVYAGICEDHKRKGLHPSSQEHSRTDIHTMNDFRKWSTVSQKLSEETAIHGYCVEDAIGIKESFNGRNGTHIFPATIAAAQKTKYAKLESDEGMLVGRDETHGHRKFSEEKQLLTDQLTASAKRPAEAYSVLRKEDEGKQSYLAGFQESNNDTVKAYAERKKKLKVGGEQRFVRVKQEAANGNEIFLRELENAVEATAGGDALRLDPANCGRSLSIRDVTSSLEILNDHQGQLWSTVKRKKLTDAVQPRFRSEGETACDRGNSYHTYSQTINFFDGTADQIKEGEFGSQVPNRSAKAWGDGHVSPAAFGKSSSVSLERSDQIVHQNPGTCEGSYDKRHWHGNDQTGLKSGRQSVQREDQYINRHGHKDQA